MSITNRTVYFDNAGGVTRFWDWAKVTTTIGSMSEPFSIDLRHSPDVDFETVDPEDEIRRIDDIRAADVDRQQILLGGGDHTMGGYQLPRTGR